MPITNKSRKDLFLRGVTLPHRIRAEVSSGSLKIGKSKMELKKEVSLTADSRVELEAAASGDTTSDGSLHLVCYTGKQMNLGGWPYPVVIDLRGARFDKKVTPIIADHKTEKRVGHTTEQVILKAGEKGTFKGQKISGPLIAATGIRSSDMEVAKGIVKDLKSGFPFQVSVGATVLAATFVDEDESIEVNGASFDGPIIVATRSAIRELSVLVLGADNDTSTVIAARLSEENDMDFEDFLKDLGLVLAEMSEESIAKYRQLWAGREKPSPKKKKGRKKILASVDDDDDDDDDDADDDNDESPAPKRRIKAKAGDPILGDYRKTISAEDERVDEIKAIANRFSAVEKLKIGDKEVTLIQARSHAVREGWSPEKFELECRRAGYPDMSEGGPAIHMVLKDVEAKALECAILRQAMIPSTGIRACDGEKFGLETMFDTKTLEASHSRQYQINNSIEALMGLQLKAAGRNLGYLRGQGSELMAEAHRALGEIKASGFSTLNVVNVLENVMHKAALSGFSATEGVWRQITGRKPLNDFKVHSLYRMDYDGHFRKVAPDGELKHISMVDTKKTIQAETYGAMITIDRKTRRNDDLGLVVSQARGFGTLGAQRIEEAIMVLLLSNPSSFFHANNTNLITGGSSALSITSLETATVSFRNKVINGKPISVGPSLLLVGTTNELLAGRLFRETRTEVTTTAGTQAFADNPWAGRYRPVVSGYLNNTSITDQDGKAISGQSSTQFYLFANPDAPQGSALVIGFLDGRETPYFDEAETQFSIPGGIQMRAYFDFGVAMHIPQMALKSAGA